MCFFFKQSKSEKEMQKHFQAKVINGRLIHPDDYNGFSHPYTAVIKNETPEVIDFLQWGLIPHWAKDRSFQKNTLNARIETITEKPSFRDCVTHRCIIPADGFYEWQWMDEKGKRKEKYHIHLPNEELFGFAGLWSKWTDNESGEFIETYAILTTEANELMAKIHNSKKRMPVILHPDSKTDWLLDAKLEMANDLLVGDNIGGGFSNKLF